MHVNREFLESSTTVIVTIIPSTVFAHSCGHHGLLGCSASVSKLCVGLLLHVVGHKCPHILYKHMLLCVLMYELTHTACRLVENLVSIQIATVVDKGSSSCFTIV